MNVGELIEKLQRYDPEQMVVVNGYDKFFKYGLIIIEYGLI